VRYVDVTDTQAVADAAAGADLVWIESPTNPALEVADLDAIGRAAREAGALFGVDNTFATPLLQRPLESGADLVVHSATKSISGHSDVVMGAVIARDRALRDRIEARRRLNGAIPGPMESFLALRGLRTLPVRLERAQATAKALVERLTGHPALEEVRYPGFGAIISIVVAGGADAAERVAEATRVWVHSTSLGGVESQLERRRRWPAEAETIPDGLVRLSVGLEHPEDLARDLEQALTAAAPPVATH
jgi:cystathionine gamma-synthase